jgi:hypothetical protein
MQACSSHIANQATNGFSFDKCIAVNEFHEMLGHCGAERLQNTAHVHGIKLTGTVEVCQDCAIAKARQKKLSE